jgi:haloacetate dehalogenase
MIRWTKRNRGALPARCCPCGAPAGRSTPYYERDGGPLGIWRQWADHGQAMKGGHFFPEENPKKTADPLRKFLSA